MRNNLRIFRVLVCTGKIVLWYLENYLMFATGGLSMLLFSSALKAQNVSYLSTVPLRFI